MEADVLNGGDATTLDPSISPVLRNLGVCQREPNFVKYPTWQDLKAHINSDILAPLFESGKSPIANARVCTSRIVLAILTFKNLPSLREWTYYQCIDVCAEHNHDDAVIEACSPEKGYLQRL
jgi:hypothetical protein